MVHFSQKLIGRWINDQTFERRKENTDTRCTNMMNETLDSFLNSTMMDLEDDLLPDELANIEITPEFDCLISSLMNDDDEETFSIDEFFSSNSSFDNALQNNSNTSMSPDCIALSFINPPESPYHVRYVSEISELPLNESIINPRMQNKKNLSGRYLKGLHGRYITITLPEMLVKNNSNLYIRVTRLTVPYQDIAFIHPYPIYYSSKKTKFSSRVISENSSIYFQITSNELHYCSKHFPNIILTRRKQCDLNKMLDLYPFNNIDQPHSFHGRSAKEKIILYQLKQCQLDFRLTIHCEQTNQFIDTDIFCRSTALLEGD